MQDAIERTLPDVEEFQSISLRAGIALDEGVDFDAQFESFYVADGTWQLRHLAPLYDCEYVPECTRVQALF